MTFAVSNSHASNSHASFSPIEYLASPVSEIDPGQDQGTIIHETHDYQDNSPLTWFTKKTETFKLNEATITDAAGKKDLRVQYHQKDNAVMVDDGNGNFVGEYRDGKFKKAAGFDDKFTLSETKVDYAGTDSWDQKKVQYDWQNGRNFRIGVKKDANHSDVNGEPVLRNPVNAPTTAPSLNFMVDDDGKIVNADVFNESYAAQQDPSYARSPYPAQVSKWDHFDLMSGKSETHDFEPAFGPENGHVDFIVDGYETMYGR